MYHDTARLNRRITITRYESGDPTVGPRVPSTRAPAAPPTQLAGALRFCEPATSISCCADQFFAPTQPEAYRLPNSRYHVTTSSACTAKQTDCERQLTNRQKVKPRSQKTFLTSRLIRR